MKWYEIITFAISIASLFSIIVSGYEIKKSNIRNKKMDKIFEEQKKSSEVALFAEYSYEYKKVLDEVADIFKKAKENKEKLGENPNIVVFSRAQKTEVIKQKIISLGVSGLKIKILNIAHSSIFNACAQINHERLKWIHAKELIELIDKYSDEVAIKKRKRRDAVLKKDAIFRNLLDLSSNILGWQIQQFIIFIPEINEEMLLQISSAIDIIMNENDNKRYKLLIFSENESSKKDKKYYSMIFSKGVLVNIFLISKISKVIKQVELVEIKTIKEIEGLPKFKG